MRRPPTIASAASTHVGRVKDHNEDVVLVRDDLRLYAVFDGAGGHNAGEVAAALGARSLSNFIGATMAKASSAPTFDRFQMHNGSRHLAAGLCKANRDIIEIASTHEEYHEMMSTAVALQLSPRRDLAHVAHVGDSRCYRLRGGQLEQLTTDHSLLLDLMEHDPSLDDAILARMPKNVLARALGKDEHVRTAFRTVCAHEGDRFLLCCDGLSNMVSFSEIERTLAMTPIAADAADRLVELANAGGGEDNISAVVVDLLPCTEASVGLPSIPPPPPSSGSSPPDIVISEMDAELSDSLLERLQRIDSLPQVLLDAVFDALEKKP